MKTNLLRFVLMAGLAIVFACGLAEASQSQSASTPASAHAKLSYRRIFKSSSPEFIEIVVRDDTNAATAATIPLRSGQAISRTAVLLTGSGMNLLGAHPG